MQTAVNNEPVQAYEGKVHVSGQFPSSVISRLASELLYFGKLVVPYATTELEVGNQRVKKPTSAAEVDLVVAGGGVAIADPSVERLRDPASPADPAPFGAFSAESSVPVMRKGLIWVVTETAIASLANLVYARFQNAGGSPPAAQLGSFTSAAGADFQALSTSYFAWQGSASIGGVDYGLLAVNLP